MPYRPRTRTMLGIPEPGKTNPQRPRANTINVESAPEKDPFAGIPSSFKGPDIGENRAYGAFRLKLPARVKENRDPVFEEALKKQNSPKLIEAALKNLKTLQAKAKARRQSEKKPPIKNVSLEEIKVKLNEKKSMLTPDDSNADANPESNDGDAERISWWDALEQGAMGALSGNTGSFFDHRPLESQSAGNSNMASGTDASEKTGKRGTI